MKILNIFIDMLGGDYLHVVNEKRPISALDMFLEDLGGTIFSRCYTPAPDTPRSTACMWSGLYPRENGCNNRLKYPGRFLNVSNKGNLWDALKNSGYEINAFMRQTDQIIGMVPNGFEEMIKTGTLMEQYIEDWNPTENSFSFFYIHDLHSYLDCNGYSSKQFKKGVELIVRLLRTIFLKHNPDDFDYILIYSDHGFRYEGVNNHHLIEDDRVKTMMFMRKRDDKGLVVDDELRSVMDIYPTVLDLAHMSIPTRLDGKSLMGKGHEYIYIEDHDDFSVRLSQSIEHWAVLPKENKYWLECSGRWDRYIEDEIDLSDCEAFIENKMDDYDTNRKLWEALHIYDDNVIINRTYSDGSIIVRPFFRNKWFLAIRTIILKVGGLFR